MDDLMSKKEKSSRQHQYTNVSVLSEYLCA
jgi:hypothetical protein